MKRTYVKPVMESEAFVANEYVAACWTFACEGGGTGVYKPSGEYSGPTATREDLSTDPFFTVDNKWGIDRTTETGTVEIENCKGGLYCGLLGNIVVGVLFGKDVHSLTDKPQKSNAS